MYRLSDVFFFLDLMDLVAARDGDDGQQDAREKQYRRKVLSTFMPRGRLMKFTVQKKKLIIVLEEISGPFEVGREYSEKEVNAIIMRVHDDYCSIRRRMIDEGLMNREEHVYKLRTGAKGQPVTADKNDDAKKTMAPAAIKESGVLKMDRKKELKKEYLEAGTTAGIVSLRCKVNGRVFLTARPNINGAFNRTRIQLETGRHFVSALQKDWNEFGKDNFVYEVLDTLKGADPAELEELRELWRDKLSAPPTNATFY